MRLVYLWILVFTVLHTYGVHYSYDNPLIDLGLDFMPTEQLAEDTWVGWLRVPELNRKQVFSLLKKEPSAEEGKSFFIITYIDNDKSLSYDENGAPILPDFTQGMRRPYPRLPKGLFRTDDGPLVNQHNQIFQWDRKIRKWVHRKYYGRNEEMQDKDRVDHPSLSIRYVFENQNKKNS